MQKEEEYEYTKFSRGEHAGGAARGGAGGVRQESEPGVIPPNAKAYGMTYGEWAPKWWQWAFSLPVEAQPVLRYGGR